MLPLSPVVNIEPPALLELKYVITHYFINRQLHNQGPFQAIQTQTSKSLAYLHLLTLAILQPCIQANDISTLKQTHEPDAWYAIKSEQNIYLSSKNILETDIYVSCIWQQKTYGSSIMQSSFSNNYSPEDWVEVSVPSWSGLHSWERSWEPGPLCLLLVGARLLCLLPPAPTCLVKSTQQCNHTCEKLQLKA